MEALCLKLRVVDTELKRSTYSKVVVDALEILRAKVDDALARSNEELALLMQRKKQFDRSGPQMMAVAQEYIQLCKAVAQEKDDLAYLRKTLGDHSHGSPA